MFQCCNTMLLAEYRIIQPMILICLIIVLACSSTRNLVLQNDCKQNEKEMFSRQMKTPLHVMNNTASRRYNMTDVFMIYLKARERNLTQEEIAKQIFNVSWWGIRKIVINLHQVTFPSNFPSFPHSYPILTGDTLRAYCDVYVRYVPDKDKWKWNSKWW